MKSTILKIATISLFLFSIAVIVNAAGWTLPNPLAAKDFKGLVDKLIDFIIIIGVAIAPVFIIYAGFMFMTSAGDSTKLTKAKNVIMYVVIGLFILFLSKGLIAVIENVVKGT